MTEKTIKDQFEDAMKCDTPEEAQAWLDKEARELAGRPNCKDMDHDAIKSMIKQNLGYFAGYHDQATSQKVHDLFGALHPIFGEPDYWEKISSADAFEIGKKMGEEWKKKSEET